MSIAATIRNARRKRDLGQRRLGERAGVSQAQVSLIESGQQIPSFDTADRLLRAAGQRLITIPTIRDDVAAAAGNIASAVQDGRDDRALRLFIQLSDDLSAEHGSIRCALTVSEPPTTGQKRWDAALAALAAYWLGKESLPLPEWVDSESRSLKRSWALAEGPYSIRPDVTSVPSEFRERGVLVDADTLASA